MGLVRIVQKHNENIERERMREIEEEKLRLMKQQQSEKAELKYCPHCGKPLP